MSRRILFMVWVSLLGAVMLSTSAAAIDWKQCKGTEIRFLMNKHP
jgi:hypothetical protein